MSDIDINAVEMCPFEDDDDADYYNDCWPTVSHPTCPGEQGIYVTAFGASCVDIEKKPAWLHYCREYVPS